MKYEIKNFRPIFDNVIVDPIKITEKDGLIRPQGEEDKAQLGKVLKIGNGAMMQLEELGEDLKVGDIVLMSPYSTNNQDLGKELVLKVEDLWAIYEGDEDSRQG